MTPLMKATLVAGEPVILSRPQKSNGEASTLPSEPPPLAMRPLDVAAYGRDVMASYSPASPAQPPVQAPAQSFVAEPSITYDEYRERFEAELMVQERQARQSGFEKGQTEGREQAAAEYASQLEALANVVGSARATLDKAIEGVSEIGVEVVCEAVTKIVGQALIDRDVVISMVREVVRQAKERSKLVVHVSPVDWPMLEEHRDRLVEGLSIGSVELIADDRVQLGGCLLETPAGNLDGRLEVQLERLRNALRAAPAVDQTEAAA